MKYQKQATLGLFALALIGSPLLLNLPAQFSAFSAANNIKASEDIERTKVKERAETADAINQAGVIPSSSTLRMRGYLDNHKRNPRPDITGYLEDETVYVYDSVGRCIGKIQERQWLWKYHYKNTCSDAPEFRFKKRIVK